MAEANVSPSQLNQLLAAYHDQGHTLPTESDSPFRALFETAHQEELAEYFSQQSCQAGAIIVREGDPGGNMFLIRSGLAVVFKGDVQAPKILGFRGPGGMVGEMALLDNRPRSASVIALEPTDLLSLNRENFYRILERFPSVSQRMMSVLSARLRQADEERANEQTTRMIHDLREQATRDALTGLYNRRYLAEYLVQEVARARREGASLGVLMMDIDNFKAINDTYGHLAGDHVLQALAELLKASIRVEDIACRYGGEEFCVIMPGATLAIASERAEQIRAATQALRVASHGQEIHATLSVGVAAYPQHGAGGSDLLASADRALYQAKQTGRNRVMVGE